MKPAAFEYYDPTSVEEALGVLAARENCRALAGGQSLVPMLNFRYLLPDHLVDLNRIPALDGIDIRADRIRFGAMTRQCTLERSTELAAVCPILAIALRQVGHRQTRNRGTIGGSLCHLDPSAELVNLACLHDARFEVRSRSAPRTLDFGEFAQGHLTTALAEDELLVAVEFRRWPPGHGYGFEEVARRHGDFAIAAVAALIELDAAACIERAAICVSGVAPVPARLTHVESMLTGQPGSHELYRAAALEAEKLDAMSDAFVDARYRQHLARVLTYRVLSHAVADARARSSRNA